ncbi:anti-sigma factor [Marinobacter bohaiensis]|uniref:anti-sigma factor n=1 Tax=Marinobacter bohaiensis TaxID=2201898 RepID=UPI000DACBCB0|nr:anti-sigma factor [Marinobacter bohaiensis]
MTDHSDQEPLFELAGEYVLGTLPEAERREVIERLKTDEELAGWVAYWENRLVPLCDTVDPMPVPDSVWQRISDSIASDPAPSPQAPLHTPRRKRDGWWHSLALWRGLTAAGFALALLMGIGLIFQQPQPNYMVVLATPDGHAPGWVVEASNRQTLTLTALGNFDVPQGKALEFWTKADDWSGPVSLGLVQPGQPLRINLNDLPPLQPNQLFEITLEDASGSPIGRPTGPIEYIGRAVAL